LSIHHPQNRSGGRDGTASDGQKMILLAAAITTAAIHHAGTHLCNPVPLPKTGADRI
jgi:hypothetical protein